MIESAGPSDIMDDAPSEGELMTTDLPTEQRSSSTFTQHALKNSSGLDFWHNFDGRVRTPPPSTTMRSSSSGVSDEMNMDTPASSMISGAPQHHPLTTPYRHRSRSSTPQPHSMAAEITRRIGKRRRDDDLDPAMFKRRAVSPGVSLQNSPILPPSPAQKENGLWSKTNREVPSGHTAGERVSNGSGSSGSSNLGPKRIGFQGMNDTNDGLMNMSIE